MFFNKKTLYIILYLNLITNSLANSQSINNNFKYTKETICNRELASTQIPETISTQIPETTNNLRSEPEPTIVKLCKPLISNENANVWEQCNGGGINKNCINSECVKFSIYYSQCLPHKLEKNALCGQDDNLEIKWMHNACDVNLNCIKQLNSMDYRCI